LKVRWLIYILVLLICGIFFSCSVNKNYKALSLFFDGVPNPADSIDYTGLTESLPVDNSEAIEADSTKQEMNQIIYHGPYQYKECNSCHDINSIGNMIIDEPELCYQCHTDYRDLYPELHGPVDGGFCTSCHNPHSSKEAALLIDRVNSLCLFCHNVEELPEADMHSDGDNFLCTDCHNPHGGSSRLMFVE
jgi:predicted CXXCH cytochrome family protein